MIWEACVCHTTIPAIGELITIWRPLNVKALWTHFYRINQNLSYSENNGNQVKIPRCLHREASTKIVLICCINFRSRLSGSINAASFASYLKEKCMTVNLTEIGGSHERFISRAWNKFMHSFRRNCFWLVNWSMMNPHLLHLCSENGWTSTEIPMHICGRSPEWNYFQDVYFGPKCKILMQVDYEELMPPHSWQFPVILFFTQITLLLISFTKFLLICVWFVLRFCCDHRLLAEITLIRVTYVLTFHLFPLHMRGTVIR